MLELAHAQHGRLPWARLLEPAIALAEQGFAMGPRLHRLLEIDPLLRRDARARALYYQTDGTPWPIGHRLRNPALAQVLRQLAREGSKALHEGPVARSVAQAVQSHAVPGRLSEDDLRGYSALEREAICTRWLEHLRVCGFPPPSSGHLTMMQILGMLQALGVKGSVQDGLPTADWMHHYNEAARLAYADRARFIADPAFAAAPGGDWTRLLDAAYLKSRASLIGPRAAAKVQAGDPGQVRTAYAPMPEQIENGTSHISVVDGRGQAVSLTTTIEASFGARVMVDGGTGLPGGFLLNNQMTDFSMSPTLVFDDRDGRLLLSVGSPGGGMIIHFTAKVLVATQQWGLNVQEAINLPNFVQVAGPLWMEKGRFPATYTEALKGRGHALDERDLTSGIQAIERSATGWFGGADPRREGVVRAD
jgi:gamma-glutamyltranspeptidase/glutathione hydrolase